MNKKINYFLIGILLSIFSLFIFTLSDNHFPTTDSIPNNITAVNIIHNQRFDLTNFEDDLIKKDLIGISAKNEQTQNIYTKTSILNGMFSVPFFYLSDKYYQIRSPSNQFILDTNYYQIIGKRYAAFVSAISVFFVFICILNFSQNIKIAVLGSITYSFGSFVFSTASQANWQHAPSLLLISLGYLSLINFFKKNDNLSIILTSLFFLISYLIRPVNIIFIVSILLMLVIYKKFKKLIPSIITIGIGFFLYKLLCIQIGIPNGYSSEIIRSLKEINIPNAFEAFLSILFSPNSGIFSYYPVFIFSLFGFFTFIKIFIKKHSIYQKIPIILFSIINIIFIFGLNSIWWCWTGGTSWGPRLLTEATIPLIFLMIFYFSRIKKYETINNRLFVILLIISIFNCLIGIYCNTTEWNDKYWSKKTMLEGAWEYKPTMINYYIFNKRSFYIEELRLKKDNSINLNTKTFLVHVPEKQIKLILEQNKTLSN